MCYSVFWKNFLILILIKSSLDSWILSLESWSCFFELESWNLILWFLKSNFLFEPWSVLDSIFNSFYDSWDHPCYHGVFLTFSFLSSPLLSSKLLWINLDSSWSLLQQWHVILIWMIITCMHWWMTFHMSRYVSWGC